MSLNAVVFARQPIFDADLEVVGYELLYRQPSHEDAWFIDGDHATARVLVAAIVDVGLDEVCGNHPAFINITRAMACGDRLTLLPPDRVVFEVVEDAVVDDELVAACQRLTRLGYRLALDDFTFRPGIERLLPLATYVKLDVMHAGIDGVAQQIEQLKPWSHLVLMAEKVETHDELRQCKELGFSMFQGFFLARPALLERKAIAPSRKTLLHVVSRLYDPKVTLNEIEKLISTDPGLSTRILRIINSAYYQIPRQVNSVRQAVQLLGLRFTRMWVSLIAMAELGDSPAETLVAAAVRAKMCERLAEMKGQREADTYYLGGLFSMLDAIMDRPMEQVVSDMPLTADVKQALLGREGPIGEALQCVVAHENVQWDNVAFEGLDESEIQQAYLEALAWVKETRETLTAAMGK